MLLPNHEHILKMGTEIVTETSENLHIFTQLSVQKSVIGIQFVTEERVVQLVEVLRYKPEGRGFDSRGVIGILH